MSLKITIFNQISSLIFTVDNIRELDIGKEIQECIQNFKEYYGTPINIEVFIN